MNSKLKEAIDLLNVKIKKLGLESTIVLEKPVTKQDIAFAEKKLGVTLPPSYVAFITQYGAIKISGALTGKGKGNDTKLFEPRQIVEQTNRYRDELYKSADEESIAILTDGILFCAHPCNEAFFLFVLSSRRQDGEMSVHHYDYQDPALSEIWVPELGFCSFEDSMVDLLKEIEDEISA